MELQHHAHLSESQSAEILQVANLSAIADGINPLSEHVALHLREGGDDHDQEDGNHFSQPLEDVEEHRGEASVGRTRWVASLRD